MTASHRCAVYTRKSTEEGLDQAFNSLHAQREACEAYIKSQAAEGWKLEKRHYDDGGYSGGTLERPALQALLQDIERGLVNIVVVYKIDRLSRSLADFARLVELFEQKGVTFVSVTQHFNTTTSMGRLTLNVLLSFAQFEREVTGERIRDKIAASKRKGMWMGGTVPFGYDVRDRRLVVNPDEAEQVRRIFTRYLELGAVTLLVDELRRQGVRSKVRVSVAGVRTGGCEFLRGQLYTLLSNRTYVGEIAHKGNIYEGEHDEIIDKHTWTRTQDLLATNRRKDRGRRAGNPKYLLTGLLYDDRGNPMTPQYTKKTGRPRYGYYVSQALIQRHREEAGSMPRIAVKEIEAIVEQTMLLLLSPTQTALWSKSSTLERRAILRTAILRIELHTDELEISITDDVDTGKCKLAIRKSGTEQVICVPFIAHKRGGQTQIHAPSGQRNVWLGVSPSVTNAIARAWKWRQWFEADEVRSLAEAAKREHCTEAYVRKLLPLAFLAPNVIQAAVDGTLPRYLKIADLASLDLPLDWDSQRKRLGITS